MNDERFERDLTALLRDVAGSEAPGSLHARVATRLAQAPAAPQPWTGRFLQLSLVAVAAVAILAAAIFVSQRPQVAPPPPGSPEPSPTIEVGPSATTQAPTPLPSASPVEPSPSPTTSTSTPLPTQIPGIGWTGLSWSGPVAGPKAGSGNSLRVDDILAWRAGYIGVGTLISGLGPDGADTADTGIAAVFVSSRDGLHWIIADQGPTIPGDAQCEIEREAPHHVVGAPDGSLIATSDSCAPGTVSPKLWRSTDGIRWTAIASPSWQAIWSPAGGANTLFDLAAGPAGIVAIGGRGSWCCGMLGPEDGLALVAFSSDGLTWHRLTLSSAFDSAWLRDVTAYSGGFAIVGRVGQSDDAVSEDGSRIPDSNGIGTPAAWVSANGETWQRAVVEGSRAAGASLSRVVAGADGLFALGWQQSTTTRFASGATSGWASVDGRSWSLVGNLGSELQSVAALAGDGSHMVLLGRKPGDDTALAGWTSTDGVNWTHLAFSGSTALPTLGTDDPVRVVPDGLIACAFPGIEGEQFWFATAIGR